MHYFATAILLSLWSLAGGMPQTQETRDIYTSRDSSGRERVYRVAETKLLSTKAWSPESEAPPLSVRDAVGVAMKHLRDKQGSMRVIGIELSASGGQDWRWYYLIRFYNTKLSAAQLPETVEVVVLMDGSVVEPAR